MARRTARRSAEPGVVVDGGDELALGAIGQEHRAGGIQLSRWLPPPRPYGGE